MDAEYPLNTEEGCHFQTNRKSKVSLELIIFTGNRAMQE